MIITLSGMVTLVKEVQPSNAEIPMRSTLLGRTISVSAVQSSKAEALIFSMVAGRVTFFRLVSFQKPKEPISTTMEPSGLTDGMTSSSPS